ncbi:MAG: hypothetical protein LUQ01_01235 [Methanolinea sp.]|nr:hypothetical protein [Methanolinea sp.]
MEGKDREDRPLFLVLFDILRLAGGAHGMSSDSLELLAALLASVVLAFYPFRWYFKVHRAANSTHILEHLNRRDRMGEI